MQTLLKPEQVKREHFVHRQNTDNNTKPSINIEPLESDLYIID